MKIDKKTILAIVLGIAAVAVVGYQLMGSMSMGTASRNSAVAATPPSTISSAPKPATGSNIQSIQSSLASEYETYLTMLEESSLAYDSKMFRNPMKPLVTKSKENRPRPSGPATRVSLGPSNGLASGYTVEGIVWNEIEPLALVNQQVVGVGERLDDGSLITEITPSTVRFTKNGRKFFLVFKEERS